MDITNKQFWASPQQIKTTIGEDNFNDSPRVAVANVDDLKKVPKAGDLPTKDFKNRLTGKLHEKVACNDNGIQTIPDQMKFIEKAKLDKVLSKMIEHSDGIISYQPTPDFSERVPTLIVKPSILEDNEITGHDLFKLAFFAAKKYNLKQVFLPYLASNYTSNGCDRLIGFGGYNTLRYANGVHGHDTRDNFKSYVEFGLNPGDVEIGDADSDAYARGNLNIRTILDNGHTRAIYTDKAGFKIYSYLPESQDLEDFTGVNLIGINYHDFKTVTLAQTFPNGEEGKSIVAEGSNALKQEAQNGKYSWSTHDETIWESADLTRDEKIHALLEKYISDLLPPEARQELIYDSTWLYDKQNQEMILMRKSTKTAYHYTHLHLLKQADNFGARAPFKFTVFRDTDDRHLLLEAEQLQSDNVSTLDPSNATIKLHKAE